MQPFSGLHATLQLRYGSERAPRDKRSLLLENYAAWEAGIGTVTAHKG